MPLNKGCPTKNTIVTPKVSHHTLHSPSCGLLVGFMSTETKSKLGFERTDVSNIQSSAEFILRGIIGIRIETLFGGQRTTIPLATKIIRVTTIDGATIMVCVW
jgi:hypothetical protein